MKKKLMITGILCGLITLCCGCVRYDTDITIYEDGKAYVSALYATADEYSAMYGDYSGLTDDLFNDSDSNVTVESYSEDGYSGYKISMSDVDLNSSDDYVLNEILPGCSLSETEDGYWEFSCNPGQSEYNSYLTYYESTIEDMDGYITLTVTFPGKVEETNATSTSNGGKTCTWDFLTCSDSEFYADYKISSPSIASGIDGILGAIIVLLVIIAVIVLVVFLSKRKKNIASSSPVKVQPIQGIQGIPNNPDSGDTCYCTNCGTLISKSDLFCGNCGQRQER